MNHSFISVVIAMMTPLMVFVTIGFPLIRHAQRAEMRKLGVQVFEAHDLDDPCAACGARFRDDTDMPCHTDDGSIWGYKWKDEETLLRHVFPDGHFDDEVVESWKVNFPDKSSVNKA